MSSEQDESPDRKDSPTSSELHELREILVGTERDQLERLEHRLDDLDVRARETGHVLAAAFRAGGETDPDGLTAALAHPVEEAMHQSVHENPTRLADALFPVMGPAIRKAILETVRGMIESTNRAIEESLSWQGLRWRIEAFRSGRSFAEVVVVNTFVFRVELLLLVHRESGLLIHQSVAADVEAEDADMVSGMLTAIRDFVGDSFASAETDSLDVMRVGDLQVLIEESPHAVLAAVVRGNPPTDLRVALQEAIEAVHGRFGAQLARFEGDAAPFESVADLLAPCLRSQLRQETAQRGWRTWIIWSALGVVVFAAGMWGVMRWLETRRWQRAIEEIAAAPGIVVTNAERRDGGFVLFGLRDPFAEDPLAVLGAASIDTGQVRIELEPYQSLDERLLGRRLAVLLEPPSSVALHFGAQQVRVEGRATDEWVWAASDQLSKLPWVANWDLSEVEAILPDEISSLTASIQATRVLMELGTTTPLEESDLALEQLTGDVERLVAIAMATGRTVQISLTGQTDRSGAERRNQTLSERRAEFVRQMLIQVGISAASIDAYGVGTEQYRELGTDLEEEARANHRVSVQVSVSAPGMIRPNPR